MSEFSRSSKIEFGRKGTEGLNKSELYGNPNGFNQYNDNLNTSEQMMAQAEEINRFLDTIDIPSDNLKSSESDASIEIVETTDNDEQEYSKYREEIKKMLSEEALRKMFS